MHKPHSFKQKRAFDVLGIDLLGALIARFMGPTWGPSGADRTQAGPMLAPWTFYLGGFVTQQTINVVASSFCARLLSVSYRQVNICNSCIQKMCHIQNLLAKLHLNGYNCYRAWICGQVSARFSALKYVPPSTHQNNTAPAKFIEYHRDPFRLLQSPVCSSVPGALKRVPATIVHLLEIVGFYCFKHTIYVSHICTHRTVKLPNYDCTHRTVNEQWKEFALILRTA